jgi:D-glycero-D-manno-heptose 1,7-bisphosphate phosphatase
MNKAAFLDRDGVINQKAPQGDYITRWEQVHFLPGVAEAIALLHHAGYLMIVVTNQRCVAKGLITIQELENIHWKMREALERKGATLDGIYYCPHEYHQCHCRKPAAGMLLNAAQENNIDLSLSWMIGDSGIDIEAGKNAGCKTARITDKNDELRVVADVVSTSLLGVIQQILDRERIPVAKRNR